MKKETIKILLETLKNVIIDNGKIIFHFNNGKPVKKEVRAIEKIQ